MSTIHGFSAIYAGRIQKLREALSAARFDAVVLNPGPGFTYLTGLHFHLMERPVVAIIPLQGKTIVVLPEFELGKLETRGSEFEAFAYTENPATWSHAFQQAAEAAQLSSLRVGVEPRALRYLELKYLEVAAPGARFDSAESCLAGIRLRKDELEIASMRKAVDVAQRALEATLPAVRVGISEKELAGEIVANMLRGGSEPDLPFAPIIAFGPNSANPHAVPTERRLERNELILFDWGATVDGYFSDLTRVFTFGEVEPELTRIGDIVIEANLAAFALAGPGVRTGDLDRSARRVITNAGYGEYFTHRTGHGLGMESHEDPYIRDDNDQILEPGMTFTIEPGIYLPGRGGVRIEDDILITDDGAVSLSDYPRPVTAI